MTDSPQATGRVAPGGADRGSGGQARLVGTDELRASDLDAWVRLAERAAEPNPFFRPEFVVSAARDGHEPAQLLIAEDRGEWIACLPVRRAPHWQRLPLPSLVPWLPEYTYLATPLIDRDQVEAGAAAIAAFVAAEREAAALVLDPLDACGPVNAALSRAFSALRQAPVTYADFERAALRRRAEPTYLEEALSARRRKDLRRSRRLLAHETGAEVVAVDRSRDPSACETFLDLERRSWKGDRGTALASRSHDAAFFRRMCAAMGGRGALQMLALEADGRTIAMQCNLLDGDVLFGFKVAYDRDWARFSPGVLLEVDAIEVFHERIPATLFDSCAAADNDLLNRLWPDRRPMETAIVPTGSRRASLVPLALRAEAGARGVARRLTRRRGR